MRPFLRLLGTLLLLSLPAVAAWVYGSRETLLCQWHCYRVGAAGTPAEAQGELAWFEKGPPNPSRLRALTARWATGNQRFDFHLARHVTGPQSSPALREAFSYELSWREDVLARWAHYWCWQARLAPDQEVASIVEYLTTLATADPAKTITWREVLDLQAIFELTGRREPAKRLSPDNWRTRFEAWRTGRPEPPPLVRPERPFPDWHGPLPAE